MLVLPLTEEEPCDIFCLPRGPDFEQQDECSRKLGREVVSWIPTQSILVLHILHNSSTKAKRRSENPVTYCFFFFFSPGGKGVSAHRTIK